MDGLGPLEPIDRAAHVARLREVLAGSPCDGLFVTHLVNARWLTGFAGSNASLLVSADRLLFFTDSRYGEYAAALVGAALPEAEVVVSSRQAEQRDRVSRAASGLRCLGLEAEHVTWADQRSYAEEWFDGIELLPTTGLLAGLRRRKDAGEVARIEAASALADRALAELVGSLAAGPTEREFASALDRRMRRSRRRGPVVPDDLRVGAQQLDAAPPDQSPRACSRATSSSSTSGPSSTATAPT